MRRLDFPRPCGSREEAKAQEILAEEIRKIGLEPIYQKFTGWWIEPEYPVLELPGERIEVEGQRTEFVRLLCGGALSFGMPDLTGLSLHRSTISGYT